MVKQRERAALDYQEPVNADLVLDTEKLDTVECVDKITRLLESKPTYLITAFLLRQQWRLPTAHHSDLLLWGGMRICRPLQRYFCVASRTRNWHHGKIVHLSDDDRLVIHDNRPMTWNPGDRMAIFFHGLCGSHASPYVARAARKIRATGVRTVRVDFRGFGDSALISRHHLYAGCSQDLRDVVQHVHQLSPTSQISLIGFSIGASIMLKALGEWSSAHPKFVDSAVAVSPPIDLVRSCANLQNNGNRIYDHYFVRQLKANLAVRRRKVARLVDNNVNPLPNRLVHFDDQFTGPVWGFSGARDYYEKCSSGPLLTKVQVPTVMLASKDDPGGSLSDVFQLADVVQNQFGHNPPGRPSGVSWPSSFRSGSTLDGLAYLPVD